MNTHDTCTEEQASALAGVSARTLQRFAESGYLSVVLGEDGHGRYQRQQLEEIFGTTRSDSFDTIAPEYTPSLEAVESDEEAQTPTQEDFGHHHFVAFHHEAANSEVTPQPNTSAATIEIERLRNLLAIQERMLDAKDDEIADLKGQRAWLRERVEKLEEKSDRDQILLLSETQTIRSLIAYQESRKSTVRQFLEWIGLSRNTDLPALGQSRDHGSSANSSASGRTIEVRKTANGE
jgi:hypothetical protein